MNKRSKIIIVLLVVIVCGLVALLMGLVGYNISVQMVEALTAEDIDAIGDRVMDEGRKYNIVLFEHHDKSGIVIYELKHKMTGEKYIFVCNSYGAGLIQMR